jgi:hypothetical protein
MLSIITEIQILNLANVLSEIAEIALSRQPRLFEPGDLAIYYCGPYFILKEQESSFSLTAKTN